MRVNNRGLSAIQFAVMFLSIFVGALLVRELLTGVLQQKLREGGDVLGGGHQFNPGVSQVQRTFSPTWDDDDKEFCPGKRKQVDALQGQILEIDVLVKRLEKEIEELHQRAEFLRQRATALEAQADRLDEVSPANAAKLRETARKLREEADKQDQEADKRSEKIDFLQNEIARIQALIQDIINAFPKCFF